MRLFLLLFLAAPVMAGPAELLKEGDRTFRTRDYAAATKLYEKAYVEALEAKQATVAVEAAAQVARGFLIRGKKDEGRPWLKKAKALASKDDPVGWSRYLGVHGRFQWKDENLKEATKTFVAMYEFCLKSKQWRRAVDAAHMVAITGTREQQVAWARKGIEAAEKGGFEGWLGPLWNNLGVTHQEQGDWKAALDCYKKARHYHWKVGRELNKLAADWAVGMALRETGELEEAMRWLRPVLAWAERWHSEKPGAERGEWIGLACRELGYAQMDLIRRDKRSERVVEARTLLGRARRRLKDAKMEEWDPKAWKALNDRIAELRQPK